MEENHSADFDKKTDCLGTNLGEFHNGYFSNPKNAEIFPKVILNHIRNNNTPPEKTIKILGIGSGAGLLEIMVYRALVETGYSVEMVISDKIPEAVVSHYPGYQIRKNDKIQKMVFDARSIPFEDEFFDIVVTRDSVHYQPTIEERLAVLREVKRVLKPAGLFLNQEPDFPNKAEANLANFERHLAGKNVQHLPGSQIAEIHKDVFGEENVKRLENTNLPPVYSDENNLVSRYKISEKERETMVKEIISQIEILLENTSTNNVQILQDDDNRYMRLTPVQLIHAQKSI